MRAKQAQVVVETWQMSGILIEKYAYSAGAVEPLPKHSHQEYQLGISFDCQGEYFYRGAYHPIPIGNLSIIHSGEVHAPSERTYLAQAATFLMMQIEARVWEQTALEIADTVKIPFFTQPVLGDRVLGKLFQNLCLAAELNSSQLTKDALFLDFCSRLIAQNEDFPAKSRASVTPEIAQVCDYLQATDDDRVSLAELAAMTGMSRYYLSRTFRRQKGISLSAYQTQVKVDRAKKLLAQGIPISTVATATGFY